MHFDNDPGCGMALHWVQHHLPIVRAGGIFNASGKEGPPKLARYARGDIEALLALLRNFSLLGLYIRYHNCPADYTSLFLELQAMFQQLDSAIAPSAEAMQPLGCVPETPPDWTDRTRWRRIFSLWNRLTTRIDSLPPLHGSLFDIPSPRSAEQELIAGLMAEHSAILRCSPEVTLRDFSVITMNLITARSQEIWDAPPVWHHPYWMQHRLFLVVVPGVMNPY